MYSFFGTAISVFLTMRIPNVCIGITLIAVVEAEYKYYCEFQLPLLAMCVGREAGGPWRSLSMHGALINPRQPQHIRYRDDECIVKDSSKSAAGGSIRVDPHLPCSIEGMQGKKMCYTKKVAARRPTMLQLTDSHGYDLLNELEKLEPIHLQHLRVPECQSAGETVATFVSHEPQHWKVEVQEEDCPLPRWKLGRSLGGNRHVRRLKATFSIEKSDGTSQVVPILRTVNNVMELGPREGASRTEAFFFGVKTRRELHQGVMITFGGKPRMLFNTTIRPSFILESE